MRDKNESSYVYLILCQQYSLDYSQLWLDSRRNVEGVSGLDVLQDLVVAQALEGEAPECDHLVEKDAVGPDVRHWSEETVREWFGRHPADREHA